MTEQVYQEVLKGKDKLYEDAFVIEALVTQKMIHKVKVQLPEEVQGLGCGERSAFKLLKDMKVDAIITDDQRFIRYLDKEGVEFITPTDVIVTMTLKRMIHRTIGDHALESLKPFIKKENYQLAKEFIGGY